MKGIIIPGNITGHSIFVEVLVGAIVLLIGLVGYFTGVSILAVLAAVIGGLYVIYSAWSSSKILKEGISPRMILQKRQSSMVLGSFRGPL